MSIDVYNAGTYKKLNFGLVIIKTRPLFNRGSGKLMTLLLNKYINILVFLHRSLISNIKLTKID